jgi:hypothetical protein
LHLHNLEQERSQNMKRALIVPAAFALLTVMSANAQEMNEAAPAVNASKAAVFDEIPADEEGMSVEQLNDVQLGRLQQDGQEIAEVEHDADAKATVAETPQPQKADATEPQEEVVFKEVGEEVVGPDGDVTVVEVSGPYEETEAQAVANGDMAPPADETADQ